MAIVFANTDGTWQTASIWDTWNEQTQQSEPYSNVPQVGDIVYLNNHTVTTTTDINIGNGLITNDSNDTYGIVEGGKLRLNYSLFTLTANLFAKSGILVSTSSTQQNRTETIIGNIENDAGIVIYYESAYTGSWYRDLILTGNIHCRNANIIMFANPDANNYPAIQNVYITGNLIFDSWSYRLFGNRNIRTQITVTGNITRGQLSANVNELNLIGNLSSKDNGNLTATKITLNGKIEYESYDNKFGIYTQTLIILNPDTFTWKDITEPRSNPFIIVTNAEMNNRQQYPPENEVKDGTEYVWGEKVGTYTPNYPPESVVLKDYEYGDSDDRKIGTMPVLSQQLISRLENCATVETVQQLLVAHLDN